MKYSNVLAGAALLGLAGLAGAPAQAAGVKVGVLTCNVDGGWGMILGSSKDVHCTYAGDNGFVERYDGSVGKLGVDIGYTSSGTITWNVIAPASNMGPGALEGTYAGATAGATIGVGLGANVLIGGFDRSFALQPVSIENNTGLNVAAGIGTLNLHFNRG